MLYHYGPLLIESGRQPGVFGKIVERAIGSGWCGVDLFFVLSGFLITGILHDTKDCRGYFRTFYARRTLRIFPLYYGVLVVTFLVVPLFGAGSKVPNEIGNQAWFWLYGVNLLRVLYGSEACGGLEHFWSLAVEEHFYLFWPLLIFVLSRVAAMRACVALVIGAFLFRGIGVFLDASMANYMLTPSRIDTMAVGAFLALAVRGPGGLRPVADRARVVAAVSGFAIACLLVAHHGLLYCFGVDTQTVGYSLLGIFFGTAMIATVGLEGKGWISRISRGSALGFIGKYSYGIYVYHFSIVPTLARTIGLDRNVRSIAPGVAGGLILILVFAVGSVGMAWLSWHVYEKPFLVLKRFFPYSPAAGRPL